MTYCLFRISETNTKICSLKIGLIHLLLQQPFNTKLLLRDILKIRLLFIIICCNCALGLAQIHDIYRLDEPGLFSEGYELCFDSKGFLWLGTDKGLLKYEDHKSFKNIHPDTLYPKVVYSLIIDSLDRKWFIDLNQKINVCEDEAIKLFQPFEDHYVSTYSLDQEDQILTIFTDKGIYNNQLLNGSIDTIALFKANVVNFRKIVQDVHYSDSILYQLNHFEEFEVI